MTNWDGKDRRRMSQDNINRDRMLTEVHTTVLYIKKWAEDHDEKDERRFSDINKKILFCAIAILMVASVSGVLPEILRHIPR